MLSTIENLSVHMIDHIYIYIYRYATMKRRKCVLVPAIFSRVIRTSPPRDAFCAWPPGKPICTQFSNLWKSFEFSIGGDVLGWKTLVEKMLQLVKSYEVAFFVKLWRLHRIFFGNFRTLHNAAFTFSFFWSRCRVAFSSFRGSCRRSSAWNWPQSASRPVQLTPSTASPPLRSCTTWKFTLRNLCFSNKKRRFFNEEFKLFARKKRFGRNAKIGKWWDEHLF